jgi:hypothetical protein
MARESTIGSTFMLEKLPAAAGVAPTVITKGATTVVTVGGTHAIGDIVRLSGTGLRSLDRRTGHRISAVGAGTVTLDTDTSDDTATPAMGTLVKVEYEEVCFAEFGLDSPAPNEVDVTTMCDLERRNVPGLSNVGSATFGGPMDLGDDGIQLLIKAQADALARSMIWRTRAGQMGLLYGAVTSFTGGPQGVEQAVSFSGTFQVQDTPIYLPALA